MKKNKTLFFIAFATVAIFGLASCSKKANSDVNNVNATTKVEINYTETNKIENSEKNNKIDENGSYTSKEDVALYIYTYKKLPKNYITKSEAKKLGWDSSKGNLGKVAKGKSIGGDVFGNYEKLLPIVKGRKYYECDIDFNGKKRNAKRIIYADDFDEDIGFIYYTEDHYKTFERLY